MGHKEGTLFISEKGFTLLELIMVIVLIGIVAASAVMLVGNVLEQQSMDMTLKDMKNLNYAMVGNPELIEGGVRSSFGYIGDIGGLPSGNSLQPLVLQAGQPNWVTTAAYHASSYPAEPPMPDLGTGAGWRGPYIDDKKDDSGNYLALLDGWGTSYTYATATGQVTSYGSNRVAGGGDDITLPETSIAGQITGTVTGLVKGNQGNPIEGAIVRIYYPNGSGSHAVQQMTTGPDGAYSFTSIPIGRRTIRVISGTAPNWTIINDTATAYGNQTVSRNITIADMIAPNPPTSPSATRASYTSLNLTWTASTSPDVVSYKIYRGTTSGGETAYKTNITGTSYIDDNSGSGLGAGTTYYYQMSAVDTAGNESTLTTEFNETANPVQATAAAHSWNGPHDTLTIEIRNNDPNTNFSITSLIIYSQNCTTTCNDYVNRVTICGTNRNPTPNPAPNNSLFTITGVTINASQTCNLSIRFSNSGGTTSANYPTSVRVQMNPASFVGDFTKTGL